MKGKSQSVISILNVKTEDLKIIELKDFCLGNVQWLNKDEVVATATQIEAYRLGIVFTTSKPSKIVKINLVNDTFEDLSDDKEVHCKSPRLSPDRKTLIWLERDLLGRIHACCFRLVSLSLGSKSRIIIPVKDEFLPQDDCFSGLSKPSLPQQCFINNDEILFSDVVIDTPTLFKCNVNKFNDVVKLLDHHHKCHVLLDVSFQSSKFVFVESAPFISNSLWIGTYNDNKVTNLTCVISGTDLNLQEGLFLSKTLIHDPMNQHEDPLYQGVKFSSIYTGFSSTVENQVPLICWPHGGPHAVSTKEFNQGRKH